MEFGSANPPLAAGAVWRNHGQRDVGNQQQYGYQQDALRSPPRRSVMYIIARPHRASSRLVAPF